jgi:dihydroxyacetone kinase-like protein
MLTTESLRFAIGRWAECMPRCADELNALDGDLGDGDLGANLVRAAGRLEEAAPQLPADVGLALLRCAQAFTSVSASTYGTLLATGLMAAARLTKGREAVPWSEISTLLDAALRAMMQRGHGQLGDKTVLDAVEAARTATAGLDTPEALLAAARAAIAQACDRLRDARPRQGRARIFGDKGIGRDDPGIVALLRLVECLQPAAAP